MDKIKTGQQIRVKLKDLCDEYTVGEYGELTLKRGGKTVASFSSIGGNNTKNMFGHPLTDADFGHPMTKDEKKSALDKLIKTIGLITFFVSHEVLSKPDFIKKVVITTSNDSKYKVTGRVVDYDMIQANQIRELRADKLPSSIQELLYSGNIGSLKKNAAGKPYYFNLNDIKQNDEGKMMESLLNSRSLIHDVDDNAARTFALLNFAEAYKNEGCQNTGVKFGSDMIAVFSMEEDVKDLPEWMNKNVYTKLVHNIKAKYHDDKDKVLFPFFYVHKENYKTAYVLYSTWDEKMPRWLFTNSDQISV